jgi:hypothetical protein
MLGLEMVAASWEELAMVEVGSLAAEMEWPMCNRDPMSSSECQIRIDCILLVTAQGRLGAHSGGGAEIGNGGNGGGAGGGA